MIQEQQCDLCSMLASLRHLGHSMGRHAVVSYLQLVLILGMQQLGVALSVLHFCQAELALEACLMVAGMVMGCCVVACSPGCLALQVCSSGRYLAARRDKQHTCAFLLALLRA